MDRLHFAALDALRTEGFVLADADVVLDEARRLKLPEELPAIREAVRRVEQATAELAAAIAPGVAETVIWSHFHRDLIAREGEYVSTRLLAGGPRTFPYFRECGPRPLQAGEQLCFDTDARGRLLAHLPVRRGPRQRPPAGALPASPSTSCNGTSICSGPAAATVRSPRVGPIPEPYRPTSYYRLAHGLGMSGEHPNVPHLRSGEPYPLAGAVEAGMILCVESYIGCPAAGEGVKLEEQLLITDGGPERLSAFPFDDRLLRPEI